MSNFKSYQKKDLHDGIQYLHFFPNKYGVSIVCHSYSYGGNVGLYELAVLEGNPTNYRLTYDTPVTNDILGYLSEAEVDEICSEVEKLVRKVA